MDALVLSLLVTALLLASRMPHSGAVILFPVSTGVTQNGPTVCPGPCRCGVMNTGQRSEGSGAAEGALSRRRRFATAGEMVRNNRFPWLVAVTRLPPYSGISTGALISDRHVLTSASAVDMIPSQSLRVTLRVQAMCGLRDSTANNVTVENVQTFSSSSTGDEDGETDDLALLRLSSPVRFTSTLSPVCLPAFASSTYVGRNAMVVGFGGNSTDPLEASSTAADSVTGFVERCRPRALRLGVVPSNLCTTTATTTTGCVGSPGGPQVVCPSDAGSLIQVRGVRSEVQLIGIMTSTNNCTEGATGPAQFTLTAPRLNWLLQQTAGSCFCRAP